MFLSVLLRFGRIFQTWRFLKFSIYSTKSEISFHLKISFLRIGGGHSAPPQYLGFGGSILPSTNNCKIQGQAPQPKFELGGPDLTPPFLDKCRHILGNKCIKEAFFSKNGRFWISSLKIFGTQAILCPQLELGGHVPPPSDVCPRSSSLLGIQC